MPNNFGQLLLQQLCTRRDTAAMAFGPLDALLVRAELFHCFRRRASGTPGSCSGSALGTEFTTAQTASRDASHGGPAIQQNGTDVQGPLWVCVPKTSSVLIA